MFIVYGSSIFKKKSFSEWSIHKTILISNKMHLHLDEELYLIKVGIEKLL